MSVSLSQIAVRIIKEQALIIGPLAWDEARKVSGLKIVDFKKQIIEISSDKPMSTIDNLIAQYERLFGKLSKEICIDSVQDLLAELPPESIPMSLK
jgi:hypothetical protein